MSWHATFHSKNIPLEGGIGESAKALLVDKTKGRGSVSVIVLAI
jgi:hypothetical protein